MKTNVRNEPAFFCGSRPWIIEQNDHHHEKWFFLFDTETNRRKLKGKSFTSLKRQKVRSDRSKRKVLLFVFFDCTEHWEFIPEGYTINQASCTYILCCLRDIIRQKCPDLWKTKNYVLHIDTLITSYQSVFVRHSAICTSTPMTVTAALRDIIIVTKINYQTVFISGTVGDRSVWVSK